MLSLCEEVCKLYIQLFIYLYFYNQPIYNCSKLVRLIICTVYNIHHNNLLCTQCNAYVYNVQCTYSHTQYQSEGECDNGVNEEWTVCEYYKKIIRVSEEAVCVDCGEKEEEKDHRLECPAKERSRRICGITELGDLCDEPALVGYLALAYPSWVRNLN